MQYEFISRCQVQARDGLSAQRVLLNVGIGCLIIAMVIELILNNRFALAFVLPLAYLISLRGRAGGKAGVRDVRTELVLSKDTLSLTYFGSVMEKGRLLDRQYLIEKDKIRNIVQERDKGRVTLLFNGTVNIRESGRIISSQRISGKAIPLFLPAERYDDVMTWLGL